MQLGRVDHIGMLVEDLDASKEFFEGMMGFREQRTVELDVLRGVFLVSGDVTIELVWIRDAASRAEALAGSDRRLDHLAVSVADLAAAVGELADAGIETTPPLDTGAYLTTFTEPKTSSGIKYQFVEYTTPR